MTARRLFRQFVATAVLVPAIVAVAAPAEALSLPESLTTPGTVVRPVGLVLPAAWPDHLERGAVHTYIVKTSLKRRTAASSAHSSVAPGQLLWLGVLLTSMCGFALYLGRELTTSFPADERGPARRV